MVNAQTAWVVPLEYAGRNYILLNFFKFISVNSCPGNTPYWTGSSCIYVRQGNGGGCFSLNNNVTMADYSQKLITDLEIGEYVLSIDNFGNIGKTKVIENLHFNKNSMSNSIISRIKISWFKK